ncbi:hypothetical protein C2G38_2032035 [Gigaspora rosea]|uniref:Uncharacterized protein n=1 Tax=Gigaspora rosea TaxID=44941 RepID=A0A397VNZ5_9GLOM|nr:hypothetical protein C2G38_2032035 [Gigaspora rosea]
MQYIVTWSYEDKSVVGWAITEEPELKFDKSINSEELKNITDLEEARNLIRVSNCKQIIQQIVREDPYGFEIIDLTTKSRHELNAQGLKGFLYESIDSAIFLENGDLIVISSEIPFVIMQWNLKTLEFEMQYILNWNLVLYSLELEMNDDNKLLAVSGRKPNGETLIYVYSTESGAVVAHIQKCHVSNTFFNVKEIKQFVQNTLEKCESGQNLIQNNPNEPKKLSYGGSYTWIINTFLEKAGLTNYHVTNLKAMIGEESTNKVYLEYWDKEDSYIFENKLLENGDIIFAYPNGIEIYAVNAEKKINLVYTWRNGTKKETETAQQSINRNLTVFNVLIENIDKSNFKYLPFPTEMNTDYFINNGLVMKLYGKNKFYQLAKYEDKERIEELFDKCFEYSFSMFKSGDIYDFMLFTSQIASALIN